MRGQSHGILTHDRGDGVFIPVKVERSLGVACIAAVFGCAEPPPRAPVVEETTAPLPRPGATVDARGPRGGLPAQAIWRVLEQNVGRFGACYRAGLDRNPRLAGRIQVKFVIGRDGTPTHVADAGSDIPDIEVVGCLLGVFVGIRFPAPPDGEVTVAYPMRLDPSTGVTSGVSSRPTSAARSSPRPVAGGGVNGRLAPEIIQRVVRQNFGRFRACYEPALAVDPKLAGRVAVRFVIGRDGGVTGTADDGSSLPNPVVVACVLSGFRTLQFPAPEGGIVTVVYPIMFSPADAP